MKALTVPNLLKLIASMNGWSESMSRVTVGYMPRKVYDSFGEFERIDDTDWGWVVETSICGLNDREGKPRAEGKTLEEALLKLANAIPEHLSKLAEWHVDAANRARKHLGEFADG